MANRSFEWLLLLLIAAGAFFGLAPSLLPTQFASLTGFAGVDLLMYRLAGAATFGYGLGLAVGYRASWPALRVPIAATAAFNLGLGPDDADVLAKGAMGRNLQHTRRVGVLHGHYLQQTIRM